MTPFPNPVIREILQDYKTISTFRQSSSLLEWDLEVNMPEAASSARGFTMGQLALMRQKATLALEPLVSKAGKEKDLNDAEKGIVRVLERDIDYYRKVPPSLVDELQKFGAEAAVPWREARKKSDFQMFKPYLSKIVELKRQEAEKLGYHGHPYNALLDLYEEGLTVADLDRIFEVLIPSLKRILARVQSDHVFPSSHPLETVRYDNQSMSVVNAGLLTLLGMPEKRFRMDVSTHPFTSSISGNDVRITTRYEGQNFKDTMFSVIHECGHALYELQQDPELEYTPIHGGVSAGFHESQSRFWENVVGRSRPFVSLVYPSLQKHLSFLSGYDQKQVYSYFNTVRPSLIRVDADELTYNFHIALRCEIEKKLLSGDLSVSDVPSLWDDMMDDYLGQRPPNDSEGVLQDIHWSGGAWAIFPSYTLGNVITGLIWELMTTEGLIGQELNKERLEKLKTWLREKIHRHGSIYPPKELLRRVFSKGYDPMGLVRYLEEKYIEGR